MYLGMGKHGRVRVPAPIGSAAGAVLGAGERICADGVPLAPATSCYDAVPSVPTLVSQVMWWCCRFTVGR